MLGKRSTSMGLSMNPEGGDRAQAGVKRSATPDNNNTNGSSEGATQYECTHFFNLSPLLSFWNPFVRGSASLHHLPVV